MFQICFKCSKLFQMFQIVSNVSMGRRTPGPVVDSWGIIVDSEGEKRGEKGGKRGGNSFFADSHGALKAEAFVD